MKFRAKIIDVGCLNHFTREFKITSIIIIIIIVYDIELLQVVPLNVCLFL